MKLIFQFIRPHWKLCVATILLLIVDVTGTLVISTFAAEMLNLGTSGASFEILFSTGIKQVVAKKNLRCAVERQETIGELTGIVEEYYTGRNVIKAYNHENDSLEQVAAAVEKNRIANQKADFLTNCVNPLIRLLTRLANVVIAIIAGKAMLDGTMTVGVVQAFFQYVNQTAEPLTEASFMINSLQSALASSEKVFSIMDLQPKMVDAPDAIELDEVKGEIEFRDVWFSYVPGEWVLQGVSFHVDPRETVAFVGSTGSGKSTILSLICRNYEFQKGEILIDGIDIRKIKISSLRRHFGQMLQDVFLFSGTIRSNIVLREEGISDDEILEVCRYVNADKFIAKLDHGLDEEVRERGNNFSAGQRQLLSFARTIIHKPSVMILDEATANIDTETELLIQDSLEKMRTVGTMLIVAHRLSTIQHADNIIVLSHGKILEQGTHQQLLANHGRYYQLYMLQYHKEQLSQ